MMDAAIMADEFDLHILDARRIVDAVNRLAWMNTTKRMQTDHAVALLRRVQWEVWCIEGAMDHV